MTALKNTDTRVDAYIHRASVFARPILQHLRKLIHRACPEIRETIKWGFPHFEYHGILCSMAAFKQHCSFVLWKAARLPDSHGVLSLRKGEGMGQFGKIRTKADLPADPIIISLLHSAMQLNLSEPRSSPRKTPSIKAKLTVPSSFRSALKNNPAAAGTFRNLTPFQQKEYTSWIAGAKKEEIRKRRMATALQWLSEGKPLNWRYQGKRT